MKYSIALIAVLLIGGCSSTPDYEEPDVLTLVGNNFVGHPLSKMTGRYGAPLRSMEVAGETVYSWEVSDTLYFGNQPPLHVKCQLDAYVAESAVVRSVGMSGKQGACVRFIP